MQHPIKAKKHLGQHFLNDKTIAKAIVDALQLKDTYKKVLEIGPGTGVLTQYLILNNAYSNYALDIDKESIAYLREHYKDTDLNIIETDFLKSDIVQLMNLKDNEQLAIIGNFPYNISTQIIFKVLEYKHVIPEVVGMFQKEVAERYAAKHGSKVYGITSVLTQAFYDIEYLFTVSEEVFSPPPKVKSAVIRLIRKSNLDLGCSEKLFFNVVKTGFNQRRKTLRNALKPLGKPLQSISEQLLNLRAEQLSVDDFINLTKNLETINSN